MADWYSQPVHAPGGALRACEHMTWLDRSLQKMISFDRGGLYSDARILVSEQVLLILGECRSSLISNPYVVATADKVQCIIPVLLLINIRVGNFKTPVLDIWYIRGALSNLFLQIVPGL
jgi:hypothetical protein